MNKFNRDDNLLNGRGEDDIRWITANGSHIPIKEGETPKEAINKHCKSNKKKKNYSLNEQVDNILNDSFKDSHVVLAKETPQILQDIGVPNNPLLMTHKHVYLAINKEGKYTDDNDHYHNLGKELFLAIPKLLKSPAVVLQSGDNDLIAVLNWYDKNKNMLICPIRINGTGRYNKITIDGNIVKSVYGKEKFKEYINRNFQQHDIVAVGNKKIRDLHQ